MYNNDLYFYIVVFVHWKSMLCGILHENYTLGLMNRGWNQNLMNLDFFFLIYDGYYIQLLIITENVLRLEF